MKKVLGIIILGLLLSGCASTEKKFGYIVENNPNFIRISYDQWCELNGTCDLMDRTNRSIAANHCQSYKKFAYEFKYDFSAGGKWVGYKCYEDLDPARSSKDIKWTNYNPSISFENNKMQTKKTSLTDKKDTCKTIGFSPNTDPFANCVLKLMEIEENQVNRASQEQIANTQRSIEQEIAKEGRDQEAWKFLLGMMGTSASTSSIGGLLSPSSVSCNKTGESTSGTNKICYYNCMGSTKTINVSSMSFCPININK